MPNLRHVEFRSFAKVLLTLRRLLNQRKGVRCCSRKSGYGCLLATANAIKVDSARVSWLFVVDGTVLGSLTSENPIFDNEFLRWDVGRYQWRHAMRQAKAGCIVSRKWLELLNLSSQQRKHWGNTEANGYWNHSGVRKI